MFYFSERSFSHPLSCLKAAFLVLGGLEHLRRAALDSAPESAATNGDNGATTRMAWCDNAPSSVWALRSKVLALALDFLQEEKAARDERGVASESTLKARAAASGFVTPLEALAREATSLSWRQTVSAAVGASCPTDSAGPPLKTTETALQLLAAQWHRLLDAATPEEGDASTELRKDAALLYEDLEALTQKFKRMVAESAAGSDEDSDSASSEYIIELQANADTLLTTLKRAE